MYKLEKRFDISNNRKSGYFLVYTLKDKPPIEFDMTSLITRRSKEEEEAGNEYYLLNSYLQYKGDQFQEEYYNRLLAAYKYVTEVSLFHKAIPVPRDIVANILDMFDLQDIFHYIRDVLQFKAPDRLTDVFDETIESDGEGSRVQTYTKTEYLELAALTIAVKAVIGVIAEYAQIKKDDLNNIHRDYILFGFFEKYPKIFNSDPMQKLIGKAEKLVNSPKNEKNVEERMIIDKQLARDEIPVSIAATVVLQKLGTTAMITDNSNKNIVNKIYNYIMSKLKTNGAVNKTIRDKSPSDTVKDENSESESPIETYRSLTDIEQGKLIEFNWALRSEDVVVKQLPEKMKKLIKMEDVINAKDFIRCFESEVRLTKLQIDLLGIIFKYIIDPRAIDRINIASILNIMAVGFSYLWNSDCKALALILTAKVPEVDPDEFRVNSTTNKTKLTQELRDKLDELYPYKRVTNESKAVNVVVETIDEMADDIDSKAWIPSATDKYRDIYYQETGDNRIITPDIKIQLAEFIIKHEEIA